MRIEEFINEFRARLIRILIVYLCDLFPVNYLTPLLYEQQVSKLQKHYKVAD